MDNLSQITSDVRTCQKCELRMTATAPVPGLGGITSKYLLIGEAPGAQEDEAGVPFVGAAGRKLDKLLELAGIDSNDCYFTNVCRCRPPKNRDPRKKEIRFCSEYLWRELELVQPEYVITLGSVPLKLFSESGVTQMHGTMFIYDNKGKELKVISQYHPAAAMHQPRLWAVMLDDWENLPQTENTDYTIIPKEAYEPPSLYALDTETDGHGGLGQWSIAFRDDGDVFVLPFERSEPTFVLPPNAVMHNAKYDIRELRANGMTPPTEFHDTMIMAYCMGMGRQAPKDNSKTKSGSNMVGGLGLKYLARRHLGIQMKTWQEVSLHPELQPEYNAMDSVATLLLAEKWLPVLPKHYFDIDKPLLPVLMAMEDRGIMIDPDYLSEYAIELDNRLAKFEFPLNPNARAELMSYIYGVLDLEPWKFTETGEPSVDADVLESIDDPLLKEILEYKELFKDKSTYVDNYVKARDFYNRVHPEYKQTSTFTGRLSCARPNLQNVDKEGSMRKLFIAAPGHKLIRMDYDQLEWRVLAAVTEDPILMRELASGRKIHQVTADQMDIKYADAKTANFAIQYGAQAWTLAQSLHCTITEAREFIKKYFQKFPGVKRYQEQQREIAVADKKVTNYFGRTRRLDSMYVDQWRIQEEGVKEAINTPIQGAGGEVCKIAMVALHHKHSAPMVLQVHDELIFEVPEKEAVDYAHWIEEYVPTLVEINGAKFPVEVSIGDNWWETSQ